MRWEYKTVKHPTKGLLGGKFDAEELDKKLNELGQQGWDLVSVFATAQAQGNSRDIVAVFRRER